MPVAPGLDFTTFFTEASADPLPTAAIVVATAWYLWAARRVRSTAGGWQWWKTASFLVAVVLAAVSFLSGLAFYSPVSFSDHAAQDTGLAVLVPVFVVLSAPVSLLIRSANPAVRSGVSRAVRSPAGRFLSHPLVGLPLYGAALFAYYFSGLYADALTDPVVHGLVQFGLLAVGCVFFWSLADVDVDALPRRLGFGMRILALALALPLFGILGMALESQRTPLFAGGTLADLHYGASLVWLTGDAVCLLGAIIVFCQWLGADERQARHNDQINERAAERQLALWRASREAAARAASS